MRIRGTVLTLGERDTKKYEDAGPSGDRFRREVKSLAKALANRHRKAVEIYASAKRGGYMFEQVQPDPTNGGRAGGSTKDTTYNGWKNRATWNVALWIDNDYGLYRAAVDFMKGHTPNGRPRVGFRNPYAQFIRHMGMAEERTPDGFKWLGRDLDYTALNENMRGLVD